MERDWGARASDAGDGRRARRTRANETTTDNERFRAFNVDCVREHVRDLGSDAIWLDAEREEELQRRELVRDG